MRQKNTMQNPTDVQIQEVLRQFIRKCKTKNLSESTIDAYEHKLKLFVEYFWW